MYWEHWTAKEVSGFFKLSFVDNDISHLSCFACAASTGEGCMFRESEVDTHNLVREIKDIEIDSKDTLSNLSLRLQLQTQLSLATH